MVFIKLANSRMVSDVKDISLEQQKLFKGNIV